MNITRMSPLTGKVNSLDLPITDKQLEDWQNGELIQRAMPHLDADQREFLISGTYPGEWEKIWSK